MDHIKLFESFNIEEDLNHIKDIFGDFVDEFSLIKINADDSVRYDGDIYDESENGIFYWIKITNDTIFTQRYGPALIQILINSNDYLSFSKKFFEEIDNFKTRLES